MISANSDKLVRSLHQKKYRIKNNKFILEGIRTIDCAINNATSFSFIIYTKRFSNQNPELISKINIKWLNNHQNQVNIITYSSVLYMK